MKWKKSGSIENKEEKHNTLCIGRTMEINMTNGLQRQSYLMQEKQLKNIGKGI